LNQQLRRTSVGIVLAGLSALMYGAGDFCGGLAARKMPILAVLLFSQLTGLAAAVAAAIAFRQPLASPADLLWGAVAGLCGGAGLAVLYRALATTPVAVVSPIAALTGAAIPVILGILVGERPGRLAWVGMSSAVPAIILLSGRATEHAEVSAVPRAVLMGTAAGIGFGLFFFTISRTSSPSGLWPLVAARLCTISLVAIFAILRRSSLRPARQGFLVVLLCGALDMGANIAFLLASRLGLLAITAVVASLYPGPTVLLAVLLFRERLTVPRVLGLALSIAGVAFISM
jgi:drug/metabolite transporter (DMT)-like permease